MRGGYDPLKGGEGSQSDIQQMGGGQPCMLLSLRETFHFTSHSCVAKSFIERFIRLLAHPLYLSRHLCIIRYDEEAKGTRHLWGNEAIPERDIHPIVDPDW